MSPVLGILLSALSLAGFGSSTNLLSRGEELAVTSRRCDMDRKSGIVLFDGDVRVDYRPGYTLFADRVFALFHGTNELDRLVAAGHVTITNGLRVGVCDRVVFKRKLGEIEMQGDAEGSRVWLRDETKNTISGRTMRFWTDSSQVEVTESELTVDRGGRSVKDL